MSQARQQLRFDTVEAFDAWNATQVDRWELYDGLPVAMAPERMGHARIKANMWQALRNALRSGGAGCEATMDGPLVAGIGLRRFQPDVLVICGDRVDDNELLVERPLIIVEVLSPSTQHIDTSIKIEAYFAIPSVRHYLLVSSLARLVVHHRRSDGPSLLTSMHHAGDIALDPPGIAIALDDLYIGTDLDPAIASP